MKKLIFILWLIMGEVCEVKSETQLQSFTPMVGHCWQATFPDGKKTDTHCFSAVYGGAFVKDEHVVCGPGEPYYGETWYAFDSTEDAYFRYFNSLGGVSEGPVKFKPNSFHFPEEKYQQGGEKKVYKTIWTITSANQYVSEMYEVSQQADENSELVWKMDFNRVELSQQQVVERNSLQQLHCQAENN